MSETQKKVSLDAALGAWPDAEKTEAEWEQSAQTVEARLATGDRGATASTLTEAELVSAPLGQMPEDGHNSASPEIPTGKGAPMTMQDRERDRRSLQDLARMAQMTPPPSSVSPSGVQRATEAKKDDSGIVDLAAAAAADPAAEQRARSTPLASQGLFDEDPASVRPPASMPQQPFPSVPPTPASRPPMSGPVSGPASGPASGPMGLTPSAPMVAPMPSSAPPSVAPQSAISSQMTAVPAKKGNGQVIAILLGGVVAAAAVAAGVVVYAKHKQATDAAALAARTETVAPAKAEAPKTEPVKVAQNDTDTADPAADTADPNAAPAAAGHIKHQAKLAAKAGAPAPAAAPASATKEELKLAQKDLVQGGGAAGDLGDAIQKAAGPRNAPEQTPAAATNGPQFAPGSVPQKPSQGAITGAIGSVLPAARNCLGPDDPVTYASITFASAGGVQGVSLSGGSASKADKAACIKAALGKARVAPFAEATYTTRVPVRP